VAHGPAQRARTGPDCQLFDLILGERAARITLLLFWWWIGWHFLVARTVDP